jgi:hypothetical protein
MVLGKGLMGRDCGTQVGAARRSRNLTRRGQRRWPQAECRSALLCVGQRSSYDITPNTAPKYGPSGKPCCRKVHCERGRVAPCRTRSAEEP